MLSSGLNTVINKSPKLQRATGGWWDDAACFGKATREHDPWHPAGEKPETVAEAKQICSGCPVRAECLDWALEENPRWGVYAGTTTEQRRYLRRKRKEGREQDAA